jgi:hypothetical protein
MPVIISAATSGATTLQATDAVTATITLPSATDTLVGKITPSFTTTIGVGAATPSASGAGITFPATQSASTDANTLDDYAEYTSPSTACTGALTVAAIYKVTKIGRVVTLSLPATTGTTTNVTSFSYAPVLPSQFRPSANTASTSAYIAIAGAGIATSGLILVQTDGTIRIYRDGQNATGFGTAANTGMSNDSSISWTV